MLTHCLKESKGRNMGWKSGETPFDEKGFHQKLHQKHEFTTLGVVKSWVLPMGKQDHFRAPGCNYMLEPDHGSNWIARPAPTAQNQLLQQGHNISLATINPILKANFNPLSSLNVVCNIRQKVKVAKGLQRVKKGKLSANLSP